MEAGNSSWVCGCLRDIWGSVPSGEGSSRVAEGDRSALSAIEAKRRKNLKEKVVLTVIGRGAEGCVLSWNKSVCG